MGGVVRGLAAAGVLVLGVLVFGVGLTWASFGNYWYPSYGFAWGYSYPYYAPVYYRPYYYVPYYAPVYYRPVYFPDYQTYSFGGRSYYYSSGYAFRPYWTWDGGSRCNIYWQDC